jgi:mono/diheme cytochrome c family protein
MIQKQILWEAVTALMIASGHSTAQEVGSVGRGIALAQRVCARCHAVQRQQAQSPSESAPAFQEIASTPGMTAIALSAALSTSHHTMPNIMLEPDERIDIIAYILSLE